MVSFFLAILMSYAGCRFLNVSVAVCTGIFGMLVVVLDQPLAAAPQMFTSKPCSLGDNNEYNRF
jgi:hypothetical protein